MNERPIDQLMRDIRAWNTAWTMFDNDDIDKQPMTQSELVAELSEKYIVTER